MNNLFEWTRIAELIKHQGKYVLSGKGCVNSTFHGI